MKYPKINDIIFYNDEAKGVLDGSGIARVIQTGDKFKVIYLSLSYSFITVKSLRPENRTNYELYVDCKINYSKGDPFINSFTTEKEQRKIKLEKLCKL